MYSLCCICTFSIALYDTMATSVQAENLEGYDVKVSAQGPAAVSFKREQTGGATHWANLRVAGIYLVHVTVNGHPLSGWPRTLHVTAAASEAAK